MTLKLINRRTVKLIALLTMLIDHIGARLTMLDPTLFDQVLILRAIGRIAFPLFAFQFSISLSKAKHLPRFIGNVFFLALLSEIPYDLRRTNQWINLEGQNVVWNFFLVALVVYVCQALYQRTTTQRANILSLIMIMLFAGITEVLHIDYGFLGFLMTLCWVKTQTKFFKAILPLALYEPWWVKNSLFLASLLIYVYDDRYIRFGKVEGFFYHYFYPLHMLAIYWFMS